MTVANTGQHQIKLDELGIDAICERIESGESQAEIARSLDMNPTQLCRWIDADEQRLTRVRFSRTISAEGWMDRGLTVLAEIPDNGSTAQISRAKEVAWHCRRMAAIRDPRKYGDRLDITGSVNVEHSVGNLLDKLIPQPCLLPNHEDHEDALLISPINSDLIGVDIL